MLTITTPDFAKIRAGGIHALSGTTADHLTCLDTINGLATDSIVMSAPGLIRFWYNSDTSDWEYVLT